MASLQQEASGALGVHYSALHSGSKARDVNARLEEEFADLLSQDEYCFDSEYEQCLSSRGFEYKQGSAPIVYKDRLRSKVDFWVSIGSSPSVLSIIRYSLKSFRASLTGKVVKVFMDSKNAASISVCML